MGATLGVEVLSLKLARGMMCLYYECDTCIYIYIYLTLNSKLPTIWRVEKQIDEVKSAESKVRR